MTTDRIKPLLLDDTMTEEEREYWRKKEPWNYAPETLGAPPSGNSVKTPSPQTTANAKDNED